MNKIYNLILKGLDTCKIALHPKGGIDYIFKKNSSIASFGICNTLSNIAPNIKTVIDVGANIGQFATATSKFYPNCKIYSFEPVPDCYEQLVENTKKIQGLKTYNNALGNSNVEIPFYQNSHSHASSALKVSDYQKENLPLTKNYKEIKVKCLRLDDFQFEPTLEAPILLKLDVQGFEKQVLEGGEKFIQNVEYVLLEVSFISMYDNEPLFDEMNEYLKKNNFEIIAPIGSLQMNNDSATAQLDMFYKRKQ